MNYLYILIFIFFIDFLLPELYNIALAAEKTYISTEIKPEKNDLFQLQKEFNTWTKNNSLKNSKGFKQLGRWLWLNETRIFPDGSSPADSYYFETFQSRNNIKNNDETMGTSAWVPVGPTNVPDTYDSIWGKGIGRINCVAFHPKNPDIMWIGAPHGGIWKTESGGKTWFPLGDKLPVMKISDIAVDPLHPDTIYIATGDYAYIDFDVLNRVRNNCFGMGIMKTTDGGKSWNTTGLSLLQKSQENSIMLATLVHPVNTQNLVAAGSTGIWKSSDGGNKWNKTFSGMIWDIKKNPIRNGEIIISTGCTRFIKNTDTAAVFRSTNFGSTWELLKTNIPRKDTVARIELAYAPSNIKLIYAVATTPNGAFYGLYRTTDGGDNWTMQSNAINGPNIMGWYFGAQNDRGGQGTYDLTLLVSHSNKEEIYAGGINQWGSTDGGRTWNLVSFWMNYFGSSIHADQHFAAYNPVSEYYYFCNDGGIFRTNNVLIGSNSDMKDSVKSETYKLPTEWTNLSSGLAITEFYRFGISQNVPDAYMAGAQDNSFFFHNQERWVQTFGGDGMECLVHPTNPDTIYGAVYYGFLNKSTDGGKTSPDKSTTDTIADRNDEAGNWITPFFMSPKDPNIIYGAWSNLWKTNNGGKSWQRLSKFDTIQGQHFALPSFAMAVNKENHDIIYLYKRLYPAYNQSGKLLLTTDEGKSWTNVSKGLPLDSIYINSIAIDEQNPNVAWLAVSHFYDGLKVFKTTNGGQSWANISLNLPNLPVNSIVLDDSSQLHTIYVGTDLGVYYITDNMKSWRLYSENLPNVIVTELEIHYATKKLYASTFGRGMWVNDLVDGVTSVEGISDNTDKFKIEIYPNPNTGRFTLSLELPQLTANSDVQHLSDVGHLTSNSILQIIDITGRIIYIKKINGEGRHIDLPLDLSLLPGMYFCKISCGGENRVKKFIVEAK
ncbi:MAG: glycosyl hydrolase repeat-containing protein [Ignavibacteria bacterium]|nr:glycosyl hydrolase repeat-containing protein [Ignavibacteria bacterium]